MTQPSHGRARADPRPSSPPRKDRTHDDAVTVARARRPQSVVAHEARVRVQQRVIVARRGIERLARAQLAREPLVEPRERACRRHHTTVRERVVMIASGFNARARRYHVTVARSAHPGRRDKDNAPPSAGARAASARASASAAATSLMSCRDITMGEGSETAAARDASSRERRGEEATARQTGWGR